VITYIPNFLSPEECAQIAGHLADAKFTDGAATAGWYARDVKKNLQLTHGMAGYEAPEKIVRAAITRNLNFQMAVRPRLLHPLVFNRYETGMTYGRHVDDPVMAMAGAMPSHMRTDVSFTLFLSEPDSYQGGELAIDSGSVEQAYKMPMGGLIAYAAGTLHRVIPLTSGVRLAAVGWIQSEVRNPDQRAILYDLDRARRGIFNKDGKTDAFDLVTKCHANLLRLWAEL
jgi:PKHD-type hydroxylase